MHRQQVVGERKHYLGAIQQADDNLGDFNREVSFFLKGFVK